jgi:hypothetical protein
MVMAPKIVVTKQQQAACHCRRHGLPHPGVGFLASPCSRTHSQPLGIFGRKHQAVEDAMIIRALNQTDRHSFIGGSDTRIGDDEAALLGLWREKRGEAEPEDLSGKPSSTQPCDRAGAEPSASPVCAAHAELVAALTGHPPRTIPLDADAIDLEDRADHLDKVLGALSTYVAIILDDTAQNTPGRLDLRDAEAVLADLASDLSGTIQLAADGMAGRVT